MTDLPPLTFGTAGLRGPMRDGPDGMNVPNVLRATWAVARVLTGRGSAGATVVVGRDARHHSDEFARTTAEVFAAQGFSVILLPRPLPTPVLAFAVRHLGAAAGVQITASHNPATDNGYKLYLDGGIQIVPPTDRQIEDAMASAPPPGAITRVPVPTGGEHLIETRHAHPFSAEGEGLATVTRVAVARIKRFDLGPGLGVDRACAIGGTVHGFVMHQHEHTIRGGAHIRLEHIGANHSGRVERLQRFLGCQSSTTAMRNHKVPATHLDVRPGATAKWLPREGSICRGSRVDGTVAIG